jgi:hypothetical protein
MSKQAQWVPMKVTYLGDVHTLLTGGGGKLSPPDYDSGDMYKPKGLG